PRLATKKSLNFFKNIKKKADELGIKSSSFHRSISSDISFIPREKSAVDGFGPLGGELRTPAEFILQDSLVDRAILLAHVLGDMEGTK
ncbi:hypothetical protein ACFL35_20900, partial [Candidatus Riflebacteria bacterium]